MTTTSITILRTQLESYNLIIWFINNEICRWKMICVSLAWSLGLIMFLTKYYPEIAMALPLPTSYKGKRLT